VLSDFEAGKSNFMFFKNSARPDSIFVMSSELSDEQFNNVKEQVKNQYA
jgi:hypothetical protein